MLRGWLSARLLCGQIVGLGPGRPSESRVGSQTVRSAPRCPPLLKLGACRRRVQVTEVSTVTCMAKEGGRRRQGRSALLWPAAAPAWASGGHASAEPGPTGCLQGGAGQANVEKQIVARERGWPCVYFFCALLQAVRIARSARYKGFLLHITNTAPCLICISVTLPFHPWHGEMAISPGRAGRSMRLATGVLPHPACTANSNMNFSLAASGAWRDK